MSIVPDTITSLLHQQQQQLELLLLLLRQELAALAHRDISQLELISDNKLNQLTLIQQTDTELANTPSLHEFKAHDTVKDQIQILDNLLAKCKQQNEINQQTLEQSQLRLQQFKHELLSSRGKSGLTYTSKGQPAVDNKGKGIKA